MSFRDVKGQNTAVSFLKNAIRNDRLAHAYIFAGPDGCGRSFLAKNFAKTINCGKKKDDACDSCPSCRKIDKGLHPDVKWLSRDGKSSHLRIGQIRELENRIILKPYEAEYKVFIIKDAQSMTAEAANSFLKTLEEPPPNSVLILITESPKDLFPTIVSRCQLIRMKPLEAAELPSILVDEILDEFSGDECVESYSARDRDKLVKRLNILAAWYRDMLVFSVTRRRDFIINFDRIGALEKSAKSYEITGLLNMFENVLNAGERIKNNVNPKLALSVMFKELDKCTK